MSGGHHIRAVGQGAAQDAQGETAAKAGSDQPDAVDDLSAAVEFEEELDLTEYTPEGEYAPASDRFGFVAPTIAVALILGWSALYIYAMRASLINAANAAPSEWVRWIIDWSVPVLLVCVGWLLTMRHSRAEAKRFAQTASLLSHESRELESRLTVVNRELSLAREFLGAQSRELESLGRIASERLSTHATELQALIQNNGAQVEAIGSASTTALENMKHLRDDLPVIATSARDVSNQVGNAGRTAHEQLEKLVSGFERLNQFGKASENQVSMLDKRVGEILSGFESQLARVGDVIATRLDQVEQKADQYRSAVDDAESKALAALGERMAMLQTEAKAIGGKLREAEAGAMEQLRLSRERFEADVTSTVESLDRLDAHAIATSQKRIKELHEEAARFDEKLEVRDRKFIEEINRRQEEFSTREAQASEVLAQRLADLDDALAERREAQTRETEKLVEHGKTISAQLDQLSSLIADISAQSEKAQGTLETGLGALGEHLAQKRKELAETEKQISDLTESGIRLLEIIQSGAKFSREDLPKSITTASDALLSVEQRAAQLSGAMFTANKQAEGLGEYLIDTQSRIENADNSIEALHSKLESQTEEALAKLQGLRGSFSRLAKQSEGFAEDTQGNLRSALEQLETATQNAFATLESGARERIGVIATDLSKEAVSKLEDSLRNDTSEAIDRLDAAAAKASDAGRDATAQLRDQLAKVNELTVNLERRIARARELAEEQVSNDFARRMALITDSLNSNAIDIASALSTEVTDTSWDAYLKGDRGIFTRRAVRLLDNTEAREIADLYQSDEAFKANVSRYIHDFEAMLRAMLSTRDGNALGVTILGSDMGKLYVVLAQAIERFRQ